MSLKLIKIINIYIWILLNKILLDIWANGVLFGNGWMDDV